MGEDASVRPMVRDASDHSLLVCFGDEISRELHLQVRRLFQLLSLAPVPGVVNLHPAYASLLVSYDPRLVGPEEVGRTVAERLTVAGDAHLPDPHVVEIPVCYGGEFGPDLEEVAVSCGFDAAEVIREHASGEYTVYFLGFSPGFPYLGGMASRITAPRRATPRKHVPAGSVAIGGNQTGVYPLESPGGWQLIGRTPLTLFHPGASPPALLALGDLVRFSPIRGERFEELAARRVPALTVPSMAAVATPIRVVERGFQSTVQDLGRPGHAHLGVSASGAGDALSLRIGNWLVGNPENTAGVEMTLAGGTFAFSSPAVVAVTGSDFEPVIDGFPVPPWATIEVRQGQTLTLGPTRSGARCYLAVRGGVDGQPVLGSLSTHLTTGLGGVDGRALGSGDTLGVGRAPEVVPGGRRFPRDLAATLLRRTVLRVTRGAQWEWFGEEAWAALLASTYAISEDSSRMGLRLRGTPLHAQRQGLMLTEGVSLGALQVPPDGQPILSFVEHQTTGGYPQAACVIAADLHRVGQLRPRDNVRFEEVSISEAVAILHRQEALLRETMGPVA